MKSGDKMYKFRREYMKLRDTLEQPLVVVSEIDLDCYTQEELINYLIPYSLNLTKIEIHITEDILEWIIAYYIFEQLYNECVSTL